MKRKAKTLFQRVVASTVMSFMLLSNFTLVFAQANEGDKVPIASEIDSGISSLVDASEENLPTEIVLNNEENNLSPDSLGTSPSGLNATSEYTASDFIIEDGKIKGFSAQGKEKALSNKEVLISGFNLATEIAENAFAHLELDSVVIGEGITRIGAHAFQKSNLKKVTLKEDVKEVKEYAFADNKIVEYVEEGAIDTLGDYAFYYNELQSFETKALTIGDNAFSANKLSEVSLVRATQVGDEAFARNPDLYKVRISTQDPEATLFTVASFEQGVSPVEVIIANNANNVTSLDKRKYLINPYTFTVYLKEKTTEGALIEKIVKKVEGIDLEAEGIVPRYTIPTIEGYTYLGQETTLAIDKAEFIDNKLEKTLLYKKIASPVISVGEGKQFVFMKNNSININEILKGISFYDAEGSLITPVFISGNTPDPRISVSRTSIPAPGIEKTEEVTITLRDANGESDQVTLIYQFKTIDKSDDEIIEGTEWQYKDFIYQGNHLKGFSDSGLERLKTNKNVVLPESNPVTGQTIIKIENYAFENKKMDTVNFEKMTQLQVIGYRTFKNSELSDVLNEENLTSLAVIESEAFKENNLSKFTFENMVSLRTINAQAFKTNKFEGIELSNLPELTHLDNEIFADNGIKTVKIENNPKLKVIPTYAFKDNNVKEVALTGLPSLVNIGYGSFMENSLKELELRDLPSLEKISEYAFYKNKIENLTLVGLPKLKVIASNSFVNNRLRDLDLTEAKALTDLSGFEGNKIESLNLRGLNQLKTIDTYTFKGNQLREVDLSNLESLNRIGYGAFLDNPNLSVLSLENLPNLEQIQENAFTRSVLETLELRNLPKLKRIDGFAEIKTLKRLIVEELPLLESIKGFSHTALTDVTLKNLPNLHTIGHTAFYQTKLENLLMENLPKLSIIESYAFNNTKLSGNLDLTPFKALTRIGTNAFSSNKFSSVNFEGLDKLTTIQNNAFAHNVLEKVVLQDLDMLEAIDSNAFEQQDSSRGYQTLTDVVIKNNPRLKKIDGFRYNYRLTRISLENLPELEMIASEAFLNTKAQTLDLTVFPKLKTIGRSAFYGDGANGERNRATELKLPASIEVIEAHAYRNNQITNVDLRHLTHLKKISEQAFAQNTSVFENFKLPVTVEPIELAKGIGTPKKADLDFSQTPDVKIKLLSAKPFLSNEPLVMTFANASQVSWPTNLTDLDPANPTILFIKNMDVTLNPPPGLLINPAVVTIKHEDRQGMPLNGVHQTIRYVAQDSTIPAASVEGYLPVDIKTNPQNLATFDSQKKQAKLTQVPSQVGTASTITFVYEPIQPQNAPDYEISISRKNFLDTRFYHSGRVLNVEALFNLRNIPNNETDTKVVIQLPEYASKNPKLINFAPTIPNVELSGAPYYDTERKQVIYPIKRITTNSIAMNIRVQFEYDGLNTPMDNKDYAKAYYLLSNGQRKGNLAQSELFHTIYYEPYFQKDRLSSEHEIVKGAPVDGATSHYTNVSMTYTFGLGNLYRRIDKLVIKDTLPTYQKWDLATNQVIQAVAEFDATKNPGWQYNQAENIATFELNKEFLDALIREDGRNYVDNWFFKQRLPKLILDFPRSVNQNNILNKAEGIIEIDNPRDSDKRSYTLTSQNKRGIEIGPVNEGIIVSKTGYDEYFTPFSRDSQTEHFWNIHLRPERFRVIGENETTYHLPTLKNIEIWDFDLDFDRRNDLDRYLNFSSVRANQPMVVTLYNTRVPEIRNMTTRPNYPDEAIIRTIELNANQKYTFTDEELRETKNLCFKFPQVHLSNPNDSINLELGSRLKEGKEIPNANLNFGNSARFFADIDIEDLGIGNRKYTSLVNSYKYVRETKKYIQVTKSATDLAGNNLSNNATINKPRADINYRVGFKAGYTIAQIKTPFQIKSFKLVDVLPKDLDLKAVELNPLFEQVGGTYQTEQLNNGDMKLIFKAPYAPSNLDWIANIKTNVRFGAPGDSVLNNKAYINFEQTATEANQQIEHRSPSPVLEEGGAQLTTATHTLKLLFNDSLVGKKYIRKSSVGGAWQEEIETLPGEKFEYKFEVSNNLAVDVNQFEFFDLFPYDRDRLLLSGLLGTHPLRGSEFSNTLLGVKSIKIINIKNGAITDASNQFPITYFSKREGYPDNILAGSTRAWIENAKANPAFITQTPENAVGIHIGGANSMLPKYSKIEVILEMKAPEKDFANLDDWEGQVANNTYAMIYEGLSKYTEVPPVTNRLIAPRRNLTFKKVDHATGLPLEGAKYRFEQGGLVKEGISNPEGLIYFKDVLYKPYSIKEVEAPLGYKLDTQVYEKALGLSQYHEDLVKQNNGQAIDTVIQTFQDEKLPPIDNSKFTLRVNKKNNARDLAGVKFKLENLGTREIFEAITNQSGVLEFTNLKGGQYRLVEISNLNRFTVIEPVTFDLPISDSFQSPFIESYSVSTDLQNQDHKIYTFVIQNKSYNIELTKLGVKDLIRQKPDTERRLSEGELLSDVSFELFQTGKEVTSQGIINTGHSEISKGIFTTNLRGRVPVKGLLPNIVYKFVELQAPDKYHLAEAVEFYVDDNGTVKNLNQHTYLRPEMILITNYRKLVKSNFVIEKIDSETNQKLANAVFKLYKKQDGQYKELEPESTVNKLYTKSTDDEGRLVFNNLDYGQYRVEETVAPNGYIKGIEPIEFTVDPYESRTILKTVKNKKIDFNIAKVEKLAGPYQTDQLALNEINRLKGIRDDDEALFISQRIVYKKLKGAQLELKENYAGKNAVVMPISTEDENGYSLYRYNSGLSQEGSYLLKELKAPVGYLKASNQNIKLDRFLNYNVSQATFFLENVRQKGQIHITKFEGRGNKVLSGASFSLYKGTLSKAQIAQSTPLFTKTSNANGIVEFVDLDLGDYTIVESGAPPNYKIIEEVSHVTLSPDSSIVRKSFYNQLETTTLYLDKVDDNGSVITDLTNAQFELYYDNKLHSTGTLVAGKAGRIAFENVPLYGEYKIKETVAPNGYAILGNGELEFSVTENNPLNIQASQNPVKVMKNKEQISISASKIWQGGDLNNRPDVYFKLYRNYENGEEEAVQTELKALGKEDGNVVFGNFDKYVHLNSGEIKPYHYYVKETDTQGRVLDLAEYSYTSNTEEHTLNVTNTYKSPLTKVKVIKEWVGGEAIAKPDLKFIILRKTPAMPQLELVVGKEKDVPKAPSLIGGLLNQNIFVEFTDLPLTDNNGNPYTYFVREVKASGDAIDDSLTFKPEISADREALKLGSDDFYTASFKNIYHSPLTMVTGTKEWENGPNNRPDTYFKLYRNIIGETPKVVTTAPVKQVDRASNQVSWDNLELTDENGKTYYYSVKEVDSNGTEATPVNYVKREQGLKVTNSYVSPKITKTVEKRWALALNETVPTQVEVTLKRKVNNIVDDSFSQSKTLTEQKQWKTIFENLDKTDINGLEYEYFLTEQANVAYDSLIEEKQDHSGFIVTNRQKVLNKTVTKEWRNTTGEENPTSVTVHLMRSDNSNTPYQSVSLNNANGWQYEFLNLPTHDSTGQAYSYTIKEDEVTGYTSQIDQARLHVTNVRNVRNIEVSKIWHDEANSLDKPQEITINLYKDRANNPAPYKTAQLRANGNDNEWTYTFDNLPEVDLNGRAFVYTIEEVPVPGYQSIVNQYSVTNTRDVVEVPVEKVWNQVEAIYPQRITYRLYRDGVEIADLIATAQNWDLVFTRDNDGFKLPKTNPLTGQDYVYTLSEDPVEGYSTNIQGNQITNTQNTKTIKLKKIWVGGSKPNVQLHLKRKVGDVIDPSFVKTFMATATTLESEDFIVPTHNGEGQEYAYYVEENDLPPGYSANIQGYTVTNLYQSPTLNLKVKKVWQGGDEIQKPDLKFVLYRKTQSDTDFTLVQGVEKAVPTNNGVIGNLMGSDLEVLFNDLPMTDSSGNQYTYKVKEVKADGSNIDHSIRFRPNEDEKIVENQGTSELSTQFVNFYDSPKVSITAKKEWVNGPSDKPLVYFRLYRHIQGEEASMVADAEIKVVDGQSNQVTWENLDKTDDNGNLYIYSVKEVDKTGNDPTYVPPNYVKEENGLTVTNRYVIPKISKTVEKRWHLAQGEAKPSQVEVVLKRTLNNLEDANFEKHLTLTGPSWSGEYTGLDKTDLNGVEYVYRLEEVSNGGYNSLISSNQDDSGFIVTNSQNVISKAVKKVWINDTGEPNPSEVKVHLYRNDILDRPYRSAKLYASKQWRYEFLNLPSHDENGNAYIYTIKEENVKGYTTAIDQTNGIITNTKKLKTIEVEKYWRDDSNAIQKPEEITINLYKDKGINKTPYRVGKLRQGIEPNRWTYEFTDLPECDFDGREFEYTIEEVPVSGFKATIDKYSITNTRELVRIPVKKIWEQTDTHYPQSITYRLYQDGREISSKTVDKRNWNTVFDRDYNGLKLPKKNILTGADYRYTISEDAVIGYRSKIDGYTVTNSREKTSIQLSKVWINGPKPEVELKLKRKVNGIEDSTFVKSFKVKANKTKSDIYEVPVFDFNGERYEYFVVEEKVPENYTSTINGFEVTNTYHSPKTDIVGTKIYVNRKGEKPQTWLKLYRERTLFGQNGTSTKLKEAVEGAEIKHIKISKDDVTKVVWKNMPKTDEHGNLYSYYVKEVDESGNDSVPLGYEKTERGLTVINKYLKEEKDIHVTKNWVGISAALAPEIKLVLIKDGIKTGDFVVLNEETNWQGLFKDVVTSEVLNGKQLNYTYTLAEENMTKLAGHNDKILIGKDAFKVKVEGNVDSGFIVTNTKETPISDSSSDGGSSSDNHKTPPTDTTILPNAPKIPDKSNEPNKENEPQKPQISPIIEEVIQIPKEHEATMDSIVDTKSPSLIESKTVKKILKKVGKKLPKTGLIDEDNFFINFVILSIIIFLLLGMIKKRIKINK